MRFVHERFDVPGEGEEASEDVAFSGLDEGEGGAGVVAESLEIGGFESIT
jgi:hypothetical protein